MEMHKRLQGPVWKQRGEGGSSGYRLGFFGNFGDALSVRSNGGRERRSDKAIGDVVCQSLTGRSGGPAQFWERLR